MTDYTTMDRVRRAQMEQASDRLLAALCREHPHIIAHLQQQQQRRGR